MNPPTPSSTSPIWRLRLAIVITSQIGAPSGVTVGSPNKAARPMVRRVENVAGSIPQLVISQLLLLARMLLVHDHKGSRVRFSPQRVINQAIGQQLVQRQ